ncbi:MAG: protein kinase [Methylacidiphilales bacterium]|nr:protein kinase [Candidatus Methylacidiphilales bacterium]NJR17636.1 protein kinase [Calothrix sp. CSU_2_0]
MLLNNRYRIIQTLGSGGFGDTFLAEDTQMPSRRRCVIKQLKPINNNPQVYQLVQERFQREAAILEELGDGNNQIPRLYAYFSENAQSENGQFYLIQEYIQGQTLNTKIQTQGAMSENAVIDILTNILPVLDYVHRKGIVHRDIKPDNIIIRDTDNKPVLIDFGAVKETISTVFTPSGNSTRSIVIGTPGFMPSEQSVGRPMFASDIYSLGMTAIYLLTGKFPQEIPNDPATGAILWRQHVANVTPSFAMLLEKTIQFAPQQRFSSAREMLAALQTGSAASIPTVATYNYPPNPTQQNTVPISPANYQQSHNPAKTTPVAIPSKMVAKGIANSPQISNSSNARSILFGLLIGAGLIGSAVIIASAFNRPPQQLADKEVTSQNTISSSPTPIETQEESEPPIQIRQTQPTRRPRITTEPQEAVPPPVIETPAFSPSPEATQTPDIPIPTQTPDIPIPTQIPSPTTPSQADKPSVEEFVEDYYTTINNGNLRGAWSKLSPAFQTNKKLHPQGYASYTDWWGGRVQQVEINQVKLVEENTNTAVVNAQLNYLLKNGKNSPASVRFILVWDAASNQWLISDAQRLQG